MEKLTIEQKKLLDAIELGDFALVKSLVQEGVSPNFGLGDDIEDNPIVFCSLKGQFKIAVWLIEQGGAVLNDNIDRFVNLSIGDISLGNFIAKKIKKRNTQ